MKLPEKGREVTLAEIAVICRQYGLTDLWKKIKDDPPVIPFKSDGCSLWLDQWHGIDLYPACFLHDLKYWCGYPGEEAERLIADPELMIHIARAGAPGMAQLIFAGVRIGGHAAFRRSFSWGFGRRPV